jgi:thiamine monophosphate kinase
MVCVLLPPPLPEEEEKMIHALLLQRRENASVSLTLSYDCVPVRQMEGKKIVFACDIYVHLAKRRVKKCVQLC